MNTEKHPEKRPEQFVNPNTVTEKHQKQPVYVILLAGGSGSRMGAGMNKILLPVGGMPCIARSAEAFRSAADRMVLVCRPEDLPTDELLRYIKDAVESAQT